MQALVLQSTATPPVIENRADPEAGPGEAVVRLEAAALNRRDYWITQKLYPGIRTPVILGSDGAGVIEAVGAGVDSDRVGEEVVIQPGFGWGEQATAQGRDYHILGTPEDGTLAERMAIDAGHLYPKPSHLSFEEAAALPVAGVTAYRALFPQGGLQAGETVLVTGAGGGVAVFAIQLAVAAGAEVWVTSSSSEKIARAGELGAQGGFDYTAEGWKKSCADQAGPVDLAIDGAGGPGYAALIDLAASGGRIVNYGATAGKPESLDLFKVFWKQLRLQGSTMGSPEDFQAMLTFVEQHGLRPVIDRVEPLENGPAAIASMADSGQFGKIVIRFSP